MTDKSLEPLTTRRRGVKRRRLRRLTLRAILISTLLLAVGYAYLLHPARLRAHLERWLARADLALVDLDAVRFVPWEGLSVFGMRVAPRARPDQPDTWLFVGQATVRFSTEALMSGRLHPLSVDADDVALSLLRGDPALHSLLSLRGADGPGELQPGDWPQVRVRRAGLRVLAPLDSPDERELRREVSIEAGFEDPEARSAYILRVVEPASADAPHAAQTTLLAADLSRGALLASCGWVDLSLASPLLPTPVAKLLRSADASGEIRIDALRADSTGPQELAISLRDARLALPIEDDAEQMPAAQRFAQLTDIALQVTYQRSAASRTGETLRVQADGAMNGARFSAQADLSGRLTPAAGAQTPEPEAYAVKLEIAPFDLPTGASHPQFLRASRLPAALRAFFKDYVPSARVGLSLSAARDGQTPARLEAEMRVQDGFCRYFRFPYDFRDVRGTVRLRDGQVLLEDLVGRHGPAVVGLSGRLESTAQWTGFELAIDGRSVPLDRDLYAALGPADRALWRQARPVGLVDVSARLTRAMGSPETGPLAPQLSVDARMIAGSIGLTEGERLRLATGEVRLGEGSVMISALRGLRSDDGALHLSGKFAAPGDQQPRRDLRFEAQRIALQHELVVPGGQTELGRVRVAATANAWGQVRAQNLSDAPQPAYTLQLIDGAVQAFDMSAPLRGLTGWIQIGERGDQTLDLSARCGQGNLALKGALERGATGPALRNLDIAADGPQIEQLIRQLVPPRWQAIKEALNFSGPGRFLAQLRDAGQGISASLELSAASATPSFFPLPLHDVEVRSTIGKDGFELTQTRARSGTSAVLDARGRGGWTDGRLWLDLALQVRDLWLDVASREQMPGGLAALLRRTDFSGALSLEIDRMRLIHDPLRRWEFAGGLTIRGASLDIGLPVRQLDALVRGQTTIVDDRAQVAADFLIQHAILSQRELLGVSGRLLRERGDPWVRLENLEGSLCGARVDGRAAVDVESGSYELALNLQQVPVEPLLNLPTRAGGVVSGRVFLRGPGVSADQRSGGGEFVLEGGSLLSTPVSASLLEAQPTRRSDAVQRAQLRFIWEGSRVRFDRVIIRTRDQRFVGEGMWDQATDEVALTLVAAPGGVRDGGDPLRKLLNSASRELLHLRISGSAASPQITIEPLGNLSDAIRKMIEGD